MQAIGGALEEDFSSDPKRNIILGFTLAAQFVNADCVDLVRAGLV